MFWVASRGHHADIGGVAPGSMSPRATDIHQEGIYIDNFLLVDKGKFREKALYDLLGSGEWPARNPLQNVNDLKAQIAANEKGVAELKRMVALFGLPTVEAYMGHVQDNAAESVRRVIDKLSDSEFAVETDQGATIRVRITVDKAKREATVDFTGTSPQRDDNFNAPEPVTRAAVLYVFRVMVDDDIPMNAGCLRPIRVVVPEGSMLSPRYPAAVVAGNVEVSQNVTDCLFGALKALGSGQGTMNNLTFGNEKYQYYETICSGAPAGPGFDGAAGVHVHMTNSRLTDPEVLESRFPVVLEDFAIRRGSGGKGHWNSGDGTLRRLRFREKMELAILSGRRRVASFRHGGRRARRTRAQQRAAAGRVARDAAGLRPDRAGGGRGGRDRHADRGRVGQGGQTRIAAPNIRLRFRVFPVAGCTRRGKPHDQRFRAVQDRRRAVVVAHGRPHAGRGGVRVGTADGARRRACRRGCSARSPSPARAMRPTAP